MFPVSFSSNFACAIAFASVLASWSQCSVAARSAEAATAFLPPLPPITVDGRRHPCRRNFVLAFPIRVSTSSSSSSSIDDLDDGGDADASMPIGGGVDFDVEVPSFVTSPVLRKVYPALVLHAFRYGHPNIPLGNPDGKMCKTLRRLHFQEKLSSEESELLEGMDFLFHAFEDVYNEVDFDEMFAKLELFESEFKTGYQIPKKYPPDPELGAWVTVLRRLKHLGTLPEDEVQRLDEAGFAWTSTRKCGSSFMGMYRDVKGRLERIVGENEATKHDGGAGSATTAWMTLVEGEGGGEAVKWIEATKVLFEKGGLSKSRTGYMDDLPGIDWKDPV